MRAATWMGPAPKYQRLRSLLRDRIESGIYRPGDAVPSESQLGREHSLSRITVRRALSELEREGLIVRRHGAGTFVADPSRAGARCLVSFTSEVLRRGQVPGARLLSFGTVEGPTYAASRLRLAAGASILNIRRLRTVDGRPVYLSDAFIPAILLPRIGPADLTGSGLEQSLYRLIERHHPVPLEDGEEVTAAVIADDGISEIFELPANSPVLRKTCLLRDRDGRPVIYEVATWGVPEHSMVIWRRSELGASRADVSLATGPTGRGA